ncbi:MAG: class I SAM-dependent methyltransferase [Bacillota bacterium]
MKVLKEIICKMDRHGPGSEQYALEAANIAGFENLAPDSRGLEVGDGIGNNTVVLAKNYPITILAIHPDKQLLNRLQEKVMQNNLGGKVQVLHDSSNEFEAAKGVYDFLWSDVAFDGISLFKKVNFLRKYLKTQGRMVMAELSWIKKSPPDEIYWYWKERYPDMTGIKENNAAMERAGFKVIGNVILGKDANWDNFYKPILKQLTYFKQKLVKDSESQRRLEEFEVEIDHYVKYGDFYSYIFYIGEKK